VVGATGSGKSALADALALTLGGEVISADSMQVYRGMDIGTAKLVPSERSVPYHCVDLVEPDVPFTAALYQRAARAAVEDIRSHGNIPIMCGGTGLYVRAALDDFVFDEGREHCSEGPLSHIVSPSLPDPLPHSAAPPYLDPLPHSASSPSPTPSPGLPLREQLTAQAEEMGAEAFHALLVEADPASAALIHPNNVRRVIRAFELLAEETSYAAQQAGFSDFKAFYPTFYLGIEVAPAVLYEVINKRVDALMAAGLLNEVRELVAAGFESAPGFSQAIGYKELLGVLKGAEQLEGAVAQIKQATRRYAKRQRTWFKRDARIHWIDATDLHEKRLAGTLSASGFTQELHDRAIELLRLWETFS